MSQPVVFCTHPLHPRAVALLEGKARLVVASAYDPATLAREGRDADIIINRVPIPASLFENAPRLRAVVRHGAGMDMVPMEAALAAGVLVANTPGVNARTVAEFVFFGAMAVLRRFREVDAALRIGGWGPSRALTVETGELSGKTLGIIGMGTIGRHVATIGAGFGLTVLANSRSAASLPEGVGFRALDDLFAESDIVAVCCPLTEETRGLVGERLLARMKPTAILVNIARGPIVDEAALIEALRRETIAGAALDVFEEEPLPSDSPLFALDRVVLSPHMAGISQESMMRMGIGAAEEALRVIAGELPVNLRNPEVLDQYRTRFPA